jgi:hypothetical protein|tara:strand:- start:97 stop:525 length:429 start_codon:yes stop_codon:yes gene_type:complete
MATTTATISISSPDLMPGSPLNINASSTLMKTGITTGMELMEMGNAEIAQDYEAQLFADGPATDNGAYFIYICNTTTQDATYYIEYKIHETVIGKLYAGDWMFVPYNASDADAEIEVKALNGINKIEYAMFKTAWTLPAAES